MTIDEALLKIVYELGVTKKEAAAMLQHALSEGKIKSTYTRNDGIDEILPSTTWRKLS